MIPKIIHYCWFGPNPIPQKEQECMKSWKKYLPDYTLMFWNEQTFDINKYTFAKEAYEKKMYAFVSDFVRAKVLYEYGGLYLDSDVEVLKNFDNIFANYDVICGFEIRKQIGTAVLASKPQNEIIKEFYDFYLNTTFKTKWGDNIIANVAILTDILEKRGLKIGGDRQVLNNCILITNRELFYPKKISEQKFILTDETVAIHKCSNSWMSEAQKKRGNNLLWIKFIRPLFIWVKKCIECILGKNVVRNVEILIRRMLK